MAGKVNGYRALLEVAGSISLRSAVSRFILAPERPSQPATCFDFLNFLPQGSDKIKFPWAAGQYDDDGAKPVNRMANGSSAGRTGQVRQPFPLNNSAGETRFQPGASILLDERCRSQSAIPFRPGQDGLSAPGFSGRKTCTPGTIANAHSLLHSR